MAEHTSSIPFITNIVGGKIVLRRRNIYIRINPSFKIFCNLYFIFDNKFIPHQISVFYRKIVWKSSYTADFHRLIEKAPALQKVKTYKLPKKSHRHSRYIDFSLSPETFIIQTGKYSRTILQTSRKIPQKKASLFIHRSIRFRFRCGLQYTTASVRTIISFPACLSILYHSIVLLSTIFRTFVLFCCFIVRILKKKTLFLDFLVVLYRKTKF